LSLLGLSGNQRVQSSQTEELSKYLVNSTDKLQKLTAAKIMDVIYEGK
jgi:hypothetical protein